MSTSFIDFIPAKLHDCNSKNWYVSYYVKNPQSNKLERKTIRLNRINPPSVRLKFARKLINEINEKLNKGWNPFIEQEAARSFEKLSDAMRLFLQNKKKELRSDSMRCYKSYIKYLDDYLTNVIKNKDLYVINFDANKATDLMQYLYNKPKTSERLFNNYKGFYKTFWNWLIENQYCKTNVFQHIKSKKEREKNRKYIDFETRQLIKNYLLNNNKTKFYIFCLLCYNCLLRPKEIFMLKSHNFDLENKIIRVTGDISKTGKTRIVTIPDDLIELLKTAEIHNIKPEYYIFSTSFKSGKMLKDTRFLGKEWAKLRKALKLPAYYQFYSLKDSGIMDMLEAGISPISVKEQAGHSSLEMTNKYIQLINKKANEQIVKTKAKF